MWWWCSLHPRICCPNFGLSRCNGSHFRQACTPSKTQQNLLHHRQNLQIYGSVWQQINCWPENVDFIGWCKHWSGSKSFDFVCVLKVLHILGWQWWWERAVASRARPVRPLTSPHTPCPPPPPPPPHLTSYSLSRPCRTCLLLLAPLLAREPTSFLTAQLPLFPPSLGRFTGGLFHSGPYEVVYT